MSIVEQQIEPLAAGDNLSREEFFRRWEAMPELKRAELIGGVVYMPSPLKVDHGETDVEAAFWLEHYVVHTPGCKAGSNATWKMLRDAPQPDVYLRILPEFGGQSRVSEEGYGSGAPELAVEISLSSSAYDLHQKKDLYEAAGVMEYVVVLLSEQEVRWHRLVAGGYQILPASSDGVIRSTIFPGLWLNAPALLKGDMKAVLDTLEQGLRSPAHEEFVAHLARQNRT